MQELASQRASGQPVSKLGDALAAKGLIDFGKAKELLHRRASDTSGVEYEELAPNQQIGEKDCLAEFEDFDDIGNGVEKKSAPAAEKSDSVSTPTMQVVESALHPSSPTPQSAPADPLVGKMFGEYRVIQRLGADVAGVTYRAVFLRECRVVTLRILKFDSIAEQPEMVEKFIATVRRAYKLEHPKIQRIYTAGKNGTQLYYAAEYFAGGSLRRELSQCGKLSPLATINIALSVADALTYAHGKGMFHTQIDPSKIIIGINGEIKLIGFGLGIEAAENLDWLAESLGDMPYYVAPELAASGEARKFIGAATDLYSLGAVMFHCLTGEPPFHGETLDEILFDMYQEENLAERLRTCGEVPPELGEIVLQLMNPEPVKRIGSAQEVIKMLRRIANVLQAREAMPAGETTFSTTGINMSVTGSAPAVSATMRMPSVMPATPHRPAMRQQLSNPGGMTPAACARAVANGTGSNSSRRDGKQRHAKKQDDSSKMMIYGGIAVAVLLIIIVAATSRQNAQRERVRQQNERQEAEYEKEKKAVEELNLQRLKEAEARKAEMEQKKKEEKAAKAAAKLKAKREAAAAKAASAPAAEEVVEEVVEETPAEPEATTEGEERQRNKKRGFFGGLNNE